MAANAANRPVQHIFQNHPAANPIIDTSTMEGESAVARNTVAANAAIQGETICIASGETTNPLGPSPETSVLSIETESVEIMTADILAANAANEVDGEVTQYGIEVSPHKIMTSQEEKDLGVLMDLELKFSRHIEKQVNKSNRLLGMIRRSYVYI